MKTIFLFLFTIITSMMTAQTMVSQKWFDTDIYPFSQREFDLNGTKMHYIDEGKGDPILFVHGTPTWSFLYRRQILALSKTCRCIAPDHIGFGLSDKPKDYDYSPAQHARNLEELVAHLDLDNITLVVHDFGGPIGLSFALRHPEKIRKIVMLNTWLWETKENEDAQKIDKIIRSGLGRFLYLRMNFSPKVLLKKGFEDKKKLSKAIHKHYYKVFPNKNSRYGLLGIAKNLVGASDWYGEQWKQIGKLRDIPIRILWGIKDKFIPPNYLEKWETALPKAEITRLDCGHFIQEEETEVLTAAIRDFMRE